MNSNILPEFSREPRELRWQPNLGKNKQKCTDFNSAQKIENFSTRIVRFSGLANLNMLSEIIKEPRELPRQPNLGKNKQKIAPISVLRFKLISFFYIDNG